MSAGRAPANNSSGGPAGPKTRARHRVSRKLMRWAPFRRWYIKRTLKFIDRSKATGRSLPTGLAETARQLRRVPRQQQAEALEEAILAEREMAGRGREFRRFATRHRLSTKSDTRYRPGRPPGVGRHARRRPR